MLADVPFGENLQVAIAAGPLNFITDSSVTDPVVTVDSVLLVVPNKMDFLLLL